MKPETQTELAIEQIRQTRQVTYLYLYETKRLAKRVAETIRRSGDLLENLYVKRNLEGKMVNKAILVGRLGKDPELRHTQGGTPVTSFSMATSEVWTDKEGKKQEKTEWHNVVVWNRQAETCAQYLSKGSSAYVEGKIQTRSYEDKEGVKRYVTEVVAHNVKFLGGGEKKERGASDDELVPPPLSDDDIPF